MCMTFHAVSSREHMARNVAIVEGIVGITALIAPLMGILIALTQNTALPLWLCAFMIIPAGVMQMIRCWPYRKLGVEKISSGTKK